MVLGMSVEAVFQVLTYYSLGSILAQNSNGCSYSSGVAAVVAY
jgi:hypothetical protein